MTKETEYLKIGYFDWEYQAKLASEIQALMLRQGINSSVHALTSEPTSAQITLQKALQQGYIDVGVCLLKDLPTSQRDGLVITALAARSTPNDWLLMRKDKVVVDGVYGLADGAMVATQHRHTQAQFAQLNPTFDLRALDDLQTAIDALHSHKLDALVYSGAELQWSGIDLSDCSAIKLSTREIVPYPGQGIIAIVALATDVATRKQLQHVHHRPTAKISNVERTTLQLLSAAGHKDVGVFCEMDYADNYHVWAIALDEQANAVHKCNYSSSTSFGLAEQISKLLNSSALKV